MTNMKQDIAKFLSNIKCIIVEPSSAFAKNFYSCLSDLGAKKENIFTATRFEDAIRIIEQFQPHLIITEHQIGKKFGLDLIEKIDDLVGDENRVAVLATRNAQDSSVAEAAEEEIDAYILKPFSMGDFQQKLEEAIYKKSNPTPYLSNIKNGKSLLYISDWDGAYAEFNAAKKMSKKPSLAHFYCGYIEQSKKVFESAVNEYRDGLLLTPLHYRCLTGKFESLFELKQWQEAYEVATIIKDNYPVSPKRLKQMLIAATYSQRFDDLAEYFKIFTEFSNRPPDLVKIATAAFKTAGKAMLKDELPTKAVSFFEMGVIASQLDPEYIDGAIRELIKARVYQGTQEMYKKYPRHLQSSDRYVILGFMVDSLVDPPDVAFEKGRKVLNNIIKGDPDFFREMVKLGRKLKREMATEDILHKAVTQFPELRAELYKTEE